MKKLLGLAIVAVAALSTAMPSQAAGGPKYAGIVIDANTGNVLYNEDADTLRYPASLTKMMTLYLTFEALENRRISLTSKVPFSGNAAAEPPSKLGVRAGQSITVEQAIMALVTRSANDAATALGEFIGGSEPKFAQMMTNKARALGMTRTTYRNANGLPNTAQMTTARDQARLGIALRQHFPEYYPYFSTRSFRFGKQVIGNHNRLLGAVRGVDGIKTGYTRAAGFNLVTSVQTDGRSIVGVVMGARSGGSRNEKMKQLVARYLPQASTGGMRKTIAQPAPEAVAPVRQQMQEEVPVARLAPTGALSLPESGPVPDARYDSEAPAVAYAQTPSQAEGSSAAAVTRRMSAVAVPQPAPEYVPQSDESSAAQHVDKVTTASTTSVSGWVIQIGVSPDRKAAMGLLQSAQEKGGKVLRTAEPFAVAINAGDAPMYRARFGGFSDQKSAVNACKALKKKGIGCWASLQ